MSEVSSGKHDISPIGGISASSISSTPTTFQKAVSTPTIAIQKPETAVLGGISISPASGVTTSIKRTVAVHEEQPVTRTPISIGSSRTRVADYSTPNTANPNKYAPVTEAKPITVVGSGPSATTENPGVSEATGFIFRGIPIKM
ncbi:MAG: hypothetical protein EOM90_18100 [Alphaproteobacteria bacterium]|nr:hypothetical protein [Alphaproteobacteria bacterium]